MMWLFDWALESVGLVREDEMKRQTRNVVRLLIAAQEQRDAFEEKAYDINFRCEHAKEAMKAEHELAMQAAKELHAHIVDDMRIKSTRELMRINAECIKLGLDKQAMDEQAAAQLEMDGHRADLERELADYKVSNDRALKNSLKNTANT